MVWNGCVTQRRLKPCSKISPARFAISSQTAAGCGQVFTTHRAFVAKPVAIGRPWFDPNHHVHAHPVEMERLAGTRSRLAQNGKTRDVPCAIRVAGRSHQ
jgi:hypothetical protein